MTWFPRKSGLNLPRIVWYLLYILSIRASRLSFLWWFPLYICHTWSHLSCLFFQEIPFRHVWGGTQNNLHCSFSLEHVDRSQQKVSCQIQVYQRSIVTNCQVLNIVHNLKEVRTIFMWYTPSPPFSSRNSWFKDTLGIVVNKLASFGSLHI